MFSLKGVLLLIGYAVFLFWLAVLFYAFISYILGYSPLGILISPESQLSILGYSILLREFHSPLKKKGKYGMILIAFDMILGISIIVMGAYTIIFVNPNLFAYLCLVTGTSIILISARRTQKWRGEDV
ncbi:MAG: hypothetical protein QW660_04595 [Candidatus Bathyarchaeia archaeon]